MMIESYAVDAAIQSVMHGTDLIEKLEKNISEDARLIQEAGDLSVYSEMAENELEVSQAFHEILVANIGNSVILRAYHTILNHRYVYYQFNLNKKNQALSSLEEHKQILSCLRHLDAEGMRKAILHHLEIRQYDVSSAYKALLKD